MCWRDPCADVVCEDGFECVDGVCVEIVEPVGCDAPSDWTVIVTGSNHTIVIPDAIVSMATGGRSTRSCKCWCILHK